jgi:hypothetical protein
VQRSHLHGLILPQWPPLDGACSSGLCVLCSTHSPGATRRDGGPRCRDRRCADVVVSHRVPKLARRSRRSRSPSGGFHKTPILSTQTQSCSSRCAFCSDVNAVNRRSRSRGWSLVRVHSSHWASRTRPLVVAAVLERDSGLPSQASMATLNITGISNLASICMKRLTKYADSR